jgi:hypothetical protein
MSSLHRAARPGQTRSETLEALGVDIGKRAMFWEDKIEVGKRGRNAGQTQLVGRNDLIGAALPGDRVVIANPLCVGLSPLDAEWFLGQMRDKGVTVTVNGGLFQIKPGDDIAALIEEVGKAQTQGEHRPVATDQRTEVLKGANR